MSRYDALRYLDRLPWTCPDIPAIRQEVDNTLPAMICTEAFTTQMIMKEACKGSVGFEAVTQGGQTPKGLRWSSVKGSLGKVSSSMLLQFPWAKIPQRYFTHYWHCGYSPPGGRSASGFSTVVEHRWRASLGGESSAKIFFLSLSWKMDSVLTYWDFVCACRLHVLTVSDNVPQ